MSALEAAGSNPRQRGDQWEACCPVHDDKKPSLGVATGWDGQALVKCQAGCRTEDVLAALKLTMADLFEERPKEDRPRIVATYDYTDEAGELLFQVVRYEDKDFRQRTPDGRGGWIWKVGGVRRVLYRLPEILAAVEARRTIFVVEGEKDADALVRVGEFATCSPGGAGNWRPEYAEVFAGPGGTRVAEVVVVPDRDLPGYRHTWDIVRSLLPVVDQLHIALPRHGKDISDHLVAEYGPDDVELIDLEQLEELCAPKSAESAPERARSRG